MGRAIVYGDVTNVLEYVRLNGYGNLENVYESDIEEELKSRLDELVDDLIEEYDSLSFSNEDLVDLMEELKQLKKY